MEAGSVVEARSVVEVAAGKEEVVMVVVTGNVVLSVAGAVLLVVGAAVVEVSRLMVVEFVPSGRASWPRVLKVQAEACRRPMTIGGHG